RLGGLLAGQLAARLDDIVGSLDAGSGRGTLDPSGDRHRTMQAALDWSYRTLEAPAARLLRWLSVFAGPVELPAIEWLDGRDPLDPLATLVDKALVQAEPRTDTAPYRVLDPVRAYAARGL